MNDTHELTMPDKMPDHITLTKVLPITLRMDEHGKKKPVGGLVKDKRINHSPGMTNFAIYMEDYPDIVVLDLDTREHEMKHYIDKTYTHKTRKGWHCFFKNSYNIEEKTQKGKQKFDLLAGKNWCFFNYDQPDVAQYTEYNQLPMIDMPVELFDKLKVKASDVGEKTATRFVVKPLMDMLMKTKGLYDLKRGLWLIQNSSELAHAVMMEIYPYTDEVEHLMAVLNEIDIIGDKHHNVDYVKRHSDAVRVLLNQNQVTWRPLSDFRTCMIGSRLIYADINNGELVGHEFVKLYAQPHVKIEMLSQFVATYPKVEFAPDKPNTFNDQRYNLFNGFVEPISGSEHVKFLDYVRDIICNKEPAHYNYLLKYMAHMVQKPAERPDVAIVLYGAAKGTGKDTFHQLLGKIFKSGGYVGLTEENVFGRFNLPLERCILGAAQEIVYGGSHKEDSKLKRTITDDHHQIERKGVDGHEVKNYLRLIITSNSAKPVRATDGERRYFVLSPSRDRKGQDDWWADLYTTFNPNHLLHYLKHVNISGFNPRSLPTSKFLDNLIEENKDKLHEAIEEWWRGSFNGDWMNTTELFNLLVENQKYTTKRQFTSMVFDICGKEHFRKAFSKRGNGYVIQGKPNADPEELTEPEEVPHINGTSAAETFAEGVNDE